MSLSQSVSLNVPSLFAIASGEEQMRGAQHTLQCTSKSRKCYKQVSLGEAFERRTSVSGY